MLKETVSNCTNDGQLLEYGTYGRWYSKYSLAEEMFS